MTWQILRLCFHFSILFTFDWAVLGFAAWIRARKNNVFIYHCVQIDYFHFVIYCTLIHCARVERLFNGQWTHTNAHIVVVIRKYIWQRQAIRLCGFVYCSHVHAVCLLVCTSNTSTHFHVTCVCVAFFISIRFIRYIWQLLLLSLVNSVQFRRHLRIFTNINAWNESIKQDWNVNQCNCKRV